MIAELKSLSRNGAARGDQELLRDARVRRLALESLALLDAADAVTVSAAHPTLTLRCAGSRSVRQPSTAPMPSSSAH